MPNYYIIKTLTEQAFQKKRRSSSKRKSLTKDYDEDDNLPLSKIKNDGEIDAKSCRICLKEESSLNIFDNVLTNDKIISIKEIADVEIKEDDNYSKLICEPCNMLLQSAILFRRMCRISDKTLRETKIKQIEVSIKSESEIETKDNSGYNSMDDNNTDCTISDDVKKHNTSECNVVDNRPYSFKVDIKPLVNSVMRVRVKAERKPDVYRCVKCKIEFSSSSEFVKHKRTLEHKNALDKCPICDMVMTGSYIKTHIRRLHTKDKPYICDVCGKTFAQEAAFRRHAAIHTDDLPYKCNQCPYRGRFRESVRIHMRTHTGEKPFACRECPMTFATKSNLNRHSRQHKNGFPYECKECQRGFHTTNELQRHHKVVHSGIKDFQCNLCGKEFGWRKEMKKHQRRVHHVAKGIKGREPLYIKLEKKMQEQDDQQMVGMAV